MAKTAGAHAPAEDTPATKRIEQAQTRLEQGDPSSEAYNRLGMAYAKRARETHDPAYYAKAREAIAASYELTPGNIGADKVQCWVLLGEHDFTAAYEAARKLNKRHPDDVMIYGMLADACMELGKYEEAEGAIQWMLNLRPGNVPALTRTAYFREIIGDNEGALMAFEKAFKRIPRQETEERAWVLTHMAALYAKTGRLDTAERILGQSLELFPDYHYAIARLAEVKEMQEDHQTAEKLWAKNYHLSPHPENLYYWAQSLEAIGETERAQNFYQVFEKGALAETQSSDNCNRDLIYYLADEGEDPAKALRIAKLEREKRADIGTRQALAYALYRNGELEAARKEIDAVLALGYQDAEALYIGGAVAWAQNDEQAGRERMEKLLRLNPESPRASVARKALSSLPSGAM